MIRRYIVACLSVIAIMICVAIGLAIILGAAQGAYLLTNNSWVGTGTGFVVAILVCGIFILLTDETR